MCRKGICVRLHLTSVMITKNKEFCPRGGSPGPQPGGEVGGSGWGVSRPTPRGRLGVWLGGSSGPHPGGIQTHTQRVTRPTPGGRGVQAQAPGGVVQAHQAPEGLSRPTRPGGCISACTVADPPPSRRLLLQTVRILLECILV